MQFFLLDFALAFVALLGYRTLAAVTRDRGPVVLLEGRPHLQLAPDPEVTRPRRSIELEPALTEHPLQEDPSCCQSVDDTMTCGERPPHRLINCW